MSNLEKEIREALRTYRQKADMAYSEVQDGVESVEDYHKALDNLETRLTTQILKAVERWLEIRFHNEGIVKIQPKRENPSPSKGLAELKRQFSESSE